MLMLKYASGYFIGIFLTLSVGAVQAQSDIKTAIDAGRFTFELQSISPQRGGIVMQSPGYTVKVSKDTLNVDLPYVGRAYQANFGSTDGGLKFISNTFEYKSESRKKGGWNITLKVKGERTVKQMTFSISQSGNTSLFVTCNDRESITYNGNIK